jgi:hypothetical protein
VDERDAAQAVELVRALCDQLHKMSRQLARLERQGVIGTNSRASAVRCEAAALRRDMKEAQILIDRLERRYLNDNGHSQPRRTEQPRRSSMAVSHQVVTPTNYSMSAHRTATGPARPRQSRRRGDA